MATFRKIIAKILVLMAFMFGLSTLMIGITAAKNLNPKRSEINAFIKADVDKDRHLTKNEFRIFIKQMALAGQSTAKKIRFFGAYGFAFSTVDKNKDGILSPLELRSADDTYRKSE